MFMECLSQSHGTLFPLMSGLCPYQECIDAEDHGEPEGKRRRQTQYWGLNEDTKELLRPFVTKPGTSSCVPAEIQLFQN